MQEIALVVTPLLVGVGAFVLKLLPLVSDRVTDRVVRMSRAKHQQK